MVSETYRLGTNQCSSAFSIIKIIGTFVGFDPLNPSAAVRFLVLPLLYLYLELVTKLLATRRGSTAYLIKILL